MVGRGRARLASASALREREAPPLPPREAGSRALERVHLLRCARTSPRSSMPFSERLTSSLTLVVASHFALLEL